MTKLPSSFAGQTLPSSFAGFWDAFSMGATSDRDVGLKVLEAYYNEARGYSSFPYASFDAFLAWAERATSLATDIGELIRNNSSTISQSEAVDAVRELAHKSKGQASQGQIMQAAGSGYIDINWTTAAPQVAVAVGEGIAETGSEVLQNVGQGVIGTANLLKYLPWIILGGGALYIAVIAKGHRKAIDRAKKNPRTRKTSKTAEERIFERRAKLNDDFGKSMKMSEQEFSRKSARLRKASARARAYRKFDSDEGHEA